ncbi:unnamed protein product [Orchesella dallaii]|uniref:Choline transporter-like protein n=1 Tax=Orchesella dallaii TaxID=48710 RepID=A0ABP1QH02_9HEXA
MAAEPTGDQVEEMRSTTRRFGVFASCCCCDDDSKSDDGGKEHEVVIPKPRGCTDCAFLIVYITFCCILLLIGVFAYVYGNPLRLINGMDSFGNVCGTVNENFDNMSLSGQDMTDRPYVFYFSLKDMDRSTKICVSECPDMMIINMEELSNYYHNTSRSLCRYDFSEWDDTLDNLELSERNIQCPSFPIYSSRPILKRCIPAPSEMFRGIAFSKIYDYLNGLNIFKQILGDLAVTWVSVLALTSFSFVISFVLIIFLHWMTALISYLIMIGTALICVGFTAYMWWTYASIKMILDSTDEYMLLNEMIRNESAFLTYSIISTIFTILLVLVVLYLRNRVVVVVQLFREAGSALLAMPCLIIQPFITYISLTCFFCAWLYIVLCLATADLPHSRHLELGQVELLLHEEQYPLNSSLSDVEATTEPTLDERSISDAQELVGIIPQNRSVTLGDLSTLTLVEYSEPTWVKYLWWIYIVGLIWCSEFILACQQMVIASSVAAWYFSRNRAQMKCVIMEAICRLVKYHLGSVALGALLITLVKVPRLILKFADRVLRKWDQVKWAKWASRCCQCCLSCFENWMRDIHHNAYTVIAIQGVGFCPASKLAFSALVQNALQLAVINSIGDCVLFLAKCIAALLTGLLAVVYFQSDESLYFYAVPVLLTTIFAYFVAHCVISVFEMAVDTLFLCFCEDHNMHAADATDGDFYAPSTLLRFMTIDAVDALAIGRRAYIDEVGVTSKITQISAADRQSFPEEAIPMNPYAPTTERIEDS